MKRFFLFTALILALCFMAYMAFNYFVPYSEGIRSGELIKISKKGVVFKTWEGELSQGISGAQIFSFSVLDADEEVIEQLKVLQGKYVKLTYIERYRTFVFWGDSKYFITKVEKETSPFFSK